MTSVVMETIKGIRCSTCEGYILTPPHGVPRECDHCKAKYSKRLDKHYGIDSSPKKTTQLKRGQATDDQLCFTTKSHDGGGAETD